VFLPLATDTVIVMTIASTVADRHPVLLRPPVTVSCSHGASYVLDTQRNFIRAADNARKENHELMGRVHCCRPDTVRSGAGTAIRAPRP
jgi:hypothetical protein